MKHPLFIVCCAALLTACGDRVCTTVYLPAVEVTVLDSVTGVHREKGAELLVYSLDKGGALIWSVRGYADSAPIRGGEPGLLRLEVRQAGYVPWSQQVLVRGRGYCNQPIMERVLARLQQAG